MFNLCLTLPVDGLIVVVQCYSHTFVAYRVVTTSRLVFNLKTAQYLEDSSVLESILPAAQSWLTFLLQGVLAHYQYVKSFLQTTSAYLTTCSCTVADLPCRWSDFTLS